MSRKRKKTPNVVLRTFFTENEDGTLTMAKVTGHPRNQEHKKDPNLPAEGAILKLNQPETNKP